MTTEYVWNELRVRRNEQGEWQRYWEARHDVYGWESLPRAANTWTNAIATELDKLYPLPTEPPEPGTIVHMVGSRYSGTNQMTFIGVDPGDPDWWIVRDGRGDLDGYRASLLALGARPESDD